MSPKIILHIGLPKTATTSLQKFLFPQFHQQIFYYAGVNCPRLAEQSPLYKEIFNYCVLDKCKSKERSIKLLAKLSATRSLPILLSDEIFCVDGEISWQNKLRHLSEVTSTVDRTILLTVRDPVETAFSLYVQNYAIIRGQYPDFWSFCEKSNDFNIFYYSRLLDTIATTFDRAPVKVIPYELLERNQELFFKEFFSIFDMDTPADIAFGHSNVKQKTDTGSYTGDLDFLSILIRINRSRLGQVAKKIIPGATSIGTCLVNKLGHMKLRGGCQFIPNPTAEEEMELKRLLADSTKAFRDKTGIDYC